MTNSFGIPDVEAIRGTQALAFYSTHMTPLLIGNWVATIEMLDDGYGDNIIHYYVMPNRDIYVAFKDGSSFYMDNVCRITAGMSVGGYFWFEPRDLD